jgi:tetratricopeptide (TPR) repeat protein
MFYPAALLDAHVLSADTIATRRIWEQLARFTEDVPTLRPYADAAHAAYLMLRGELDRAIELYERLLPDLPVRYAMSWLPTRTYYAQALNLAGRHERAKRVLVEALALTDPKDAVVAMHFSEARRQLALAEAGLGDRARAAALLDELFELYGPLKNPLLLGLFHKARAEIALRAFDRADFEVHLERMHDCFHSTENPALIAQWEELHDRASATGLRSSLSPSARAPRSVEPISIDHSLATLAAATNRTECALRLILQRARSDQGYLYLWSAGALQLVESAGGSAPPVEIASELMQSIYTFAEDDEDGLTVASVTDPPVPPSAANDNLKSDSTEYQYFVLSTRQRGERTVVGGVIVEMTSSDLFRLDHGFRTAIADALCEPGHSTPLARMGPL